VLFGRSTTRIELKRFDNAICNVLGVNEVGEKLAF
jgi:hypothetical protein